MVQWSRFFEINGSTPNFSRRIGPHLSDGLGNDQIFPAFDETERVGLLYRDLLGAGLAGMWSVRCADCENRQSQTAAHCHVAPADRPRLPCRSASRMARLGQVYGALTDEDIETLSNDPPLPFFILFEAMQQTEGCNSGCSARSSYRKRYSGRSRATAIGRQRSLADQLDLIPANFT
jgi:hypothetical protein